MSRQRTEAKPKVIGLVRVSSEEQAQEGKTGLQRQRDDIARVVEANGLDLVRVYSLEGISGTHVSQSPDFQAMLRHVQEPDIAGLVVAKLDRLSRTENISDLSFFKSFEKPRRLIWTNSGAPMDPTTIEGKFLIAIQCLIGGKEKSDIIERAHTGKAINRTRADKAPDPLPRGVAFDKASGTFRYTQDAEQVRMAFEMVLEGNSLRHTASTLGFRSPVACRIALQNRWYIGIRESKYKRGERPASTDGRLRDAPKILRENPIQVRTNLADTPLVPVHVFNRVQEIIAQNRTTKANVKQKGSPFELSGILFCSCGHRYYSKSDYREGKNGYYHCPKCKSGYFRREIVDEAISNLIFETFTDAARILDLVQQARSRKSEKELTARIANADLELERLQQEKERLLTLVQTGIMDPADKTVQKRFLDLRNETAKQEAIKRDSEVAIDAGRLNDDRETAEALALYFARIPVMNSPERKSLISRVVSQITMDRNLKIEIELNPVFAKTETRVLAASTGTISASAAAPARSSSAIWGG